MKLIDVRFLREVNYPGKGLTEASAYMSVKGTGHPLDLTFENGMVTVRDTKNEACVIVPWTNVVSMTPAPEEPRGAPPPTRK